jgi:putative SOS response-associated peptidase YedK
VCNEFAQERAWKAYCEMMAREALDVITPEQPDLPFGSIHPSERALVISAAPGGAALELLPWGWKKIDAKGLILWLKAENRRDPPTARAIIPFDRFYEFRGDNPPKDKIEFSPAINEPLGMAAIKRDGRWAHLTTEPGPDVLGYHKRQPAVLRLSDWPRFLAKTDWPGDLMQPLPAGTLRALQVR